MKKLYFSMLGLVLICTPVWATDFSISAHLDPRDIMSKEVEASHTEKDAVNKTVTWTSSAVDLPTVEKHNDVCARVPEYMDGMICYKLCGGSLTSAPISWEARYRTANQGSNTPFNGCSNETGCRAFNVEYYAEAKRGCVHFGFWKGTPSHFAHADMQVIVTLPNAP